MLFQTLVQLNILILAAPALAGWNLLPLSSHSAVQAACVAWQRGGAEAAAPRPAPAGERPAPAQRQPRSLPIPTDPAPVHLSPGSAPACTALPVASPAPGSPFPHAARAP